MALIDTLIDKQDNFEIVRDQMAAILKLEVVNQMALAVAAVKDPELWNLKIFTERSNPWEEYLEPNSDKTPLVNVWYDSGNFPEGQGDVVERQLHEGIFNIDFYGCAVSSDDGAGHKPGDREAALEVQRAVRLGRNILMAGINTYLQLQGLVWQRWPQSITIFQPQLNNQAVEQVMGARLALKVSFNEFSPQVTPETLELLTVDVKRTEDGEIVLEADYDYTI